VTDVPISSGSIRLGQFLKLANAIDSGSDAKVLLAEGVVRVNGEPETRRGRQLTSGDLVEVREQRFVVGQLPTGEASTPPTE
jgi:ribosome-associated protein